MVGNESRWDNPYWEYHLPINPPIDFDRPILDGGDPTKTYEHPGALVCTGFFNWNSDDGLVYKPRLPIGLDKYKVEQKRRRMREARD